jgi:D-sedoheptulose 7-phosphate isomerase
MDFTNQYFDFVSEIAKKIDKGLVLKMIQTLLVAKKKKGRLFIIGVGGSAGNASHAVNDFRKICNIETYAPTDNISELTARTNDEGWNNIFSSWLKTSNVSKNDILLVFSVGGGSQKLKISENIVNAIILCKDIGTKVLSIVGKKDGFAYQNSDFSLFIPNVNADLITPLSESFQTIVWHCFVSHPLLKEEETTWEKISKER